MGAKGGALLAIVGLLLGCGSRQLPTDLPGIPLDLDPTLAIQTAFGGGGHACPVNGWLVTANHVVWSSEHRTHVSVAWSDGHGGEGFATPDKSHFALDLAVLKPEGNPIHYLPVGKAKVGDTVYWFEYDFRTRENALRSRRRFATILRTVAQHFILSETPVGGASGTCLLNEQGQVVGIVVAAFETGDYLGAGVAVKLPPELAK